MYANFVRPPTIRNFRLPKPNPIIPSEHDATQNPSRPLYHNGRVLFQRVYAFNTVNFRCRDRLVERGVGSIDLLVSYRPSRFDPPSTPPLSLRSKKLNFQTSRYRTWRLDHFPRSFSILRYRSFDRRGWKRRDGCGAR